MFSSTPKVETRTMFCETSTAEETDIKQDAPVCIDSKLTEEQVKKGLTDLNLFF